jgi:hypothetical protein
VQATAFRMRMRVGHRVTSVTSMAIDQRTTRTFVRRGALIRMVFSPSPAQLAQIRTESAAAPTYIDAKVKKVKKIDGSGLSCFFLMMLAGLAWLGIEAVPATVTALRRRISTFFRTRDAATTIITQSGETLLSVKAAPSREWQLNCSKMALRTEWAAQSTRRRFARNSRSILRLTCAKDRASGCRCTLPSERTVTACVIY